MKWVELRSIGVNGTRHCELEASTLIFSCTGYIYYFDYLQYMHRMSKNSCHRIIHNIFSV